MFFFSERSCGYICVTSTLGTLRSPGADFLFARVLISAKSALALAFFGGAIVFGSSKILHVIFFSKTGRLVPGHLNGHTYVGFNRTGRTTPRRSVSYATPFPCKCTWGPAYACSSQDRLHPRESQSPALPMDACRGCVC
jgi:hypothetical protein